MSSSEVTSDANLIHDSCKGLSITNETLVRIFSSRRKKHLIKVDKAYQALFGKTLTDVIDAEVSGDDNAFLKAILSPNDKFDAAFVKMICAGLKAETPEAREKLIKKCAVVLKEASLKHGREQCYVIKLYERLVVTACPIDDKDGVSKTQINKLVASVQKFCHMVPAWEFRAQIFAAHALTNMCRSRRALHRCSVRSLTSLIRGNELKYAARSTFAAESLGLIVSGFAADPRSQSNVDLHKALRKWKGVPGGGEGPLKDAWNRYKNRKLPPRDVTFQDVIEETSETPTQQDEPLITVQVAASTTSGGAASVSPALRAVQAAAGAYPSYRADQPASAKPNARKATDDCPRSGDRREDYQKEKKRARR